MFPSQLVALGHSSHLRSLLGRPANTTTLIVQQLKPQSAFVDYHYFPHITTRLRPSTVHGYRRLWSDYKAFWTSDTKLRDFRTLDGDRILDRIHAAKGVSKNTLKNIKSFLSAVFKHARRTGVLDSANPMQDVSLPKSRGAKDTYAYSLEEVTAMLIRLPLRSAAVVAVAAFTDLRKGEIAALKWDNYRQSIQRERSNGLDNFFLPLG